MSGPRPIEPAITSPTAWNLLAHGAALSPAQITANTDDYSPTGWADTVAFLRLDTDASRNLTGLAAPSNRQAAVLINVGSNELVLVHDATSTAANRFLCPNGVNDTVQPNEARWLWYDTTDSRWRVLEVGSDEDLAAIAALSGTGLLARTAADTWALRTIAGPAAGISVADGDGVSGNPTLSLANDLAALEALGGTGLAVRTGSDTWAQRTLTGTANQISVADGDGVSGNPTLSLPDPMTTPGKLTVSDTLTLAIGSQDYIIADDGDGLDIQAQTVATGAALELRSKNNNGSDDVFFDIGALGKVNDANSERVRIGYDSGNTRFEVRSEASGTGSVRELSFLVGGTESLALDTSNNVDVANGALQIGGTSVITSGRVAQNLTQANVDNLRLDGNTLSSTSGNITLDADGGTVSTPDALSVTGAITGASSLSVDDIITVQAAGDSLDLQRYVANGNGPFALFRKSRNATLGSHTIVQSGDTLGGFLFMGSDGSDWVRGATIQAFVDGTPGSNDMPTRLEFATTADGASTETLRMSIKNSGTVELASGAPLDVKDTTASTSTTTGCATFAGGVGIAGAANIAGQATLETAAAGSGSALQIASAVPAIGIRATAQGSDEKQWDLVADGAALKLRTRNDADSTSVNALVVNRTGTNVDQIDLVTGSGTDALRVDDDATAGNTRLLIYDVDNATLERVTVGAADSGGTGYKVLRIPN